MDTINNEHFTMMAPKKNPNFKKVVSVVIIVVIVIFLAVIGKYATSLQTHRKSVPTASSTANLMSPQNKGTESASSTNANLLQSIASASKPLVAMKGVSSVTVAVVGQLVSVDTTSITVQNSGTPVTVSLTKATQFIDTTKTPYVQKLFTTTDVSPNDDLFINISFTKSNVSVQQVIKATPDQYTHSLQSAQ